MLARTLPAAATAAAARLLAAAVLFAAIPAADAAKSSTFTITSSTFDADAQGWTILGEAQGPNHRASGGHPGGYVSADDPAGTSGTSYWSAPTAFLGDVGAAYRMKLTYDLRDQGPGRTFRDPDVVLSSGSLDLEYRQKRQPGSKRFTRFTVRLEGKKGWTDHATGRRPTASQMQSALAALDRLLIRGEFRNGAETFDLDNVVLQGRNR
jgi:hypothetical protein